VNKPFGTALWGVRAQSPGSGNKVAKGTTVSITLV
jgi:PASTA domain